MSAPEENAAPEVSTSRFDAALLRFGRFADRTRLLTVGGWGLFGVSTVLGAALAVPPGGAAPAVADAGEPAAPPAPRETAEPERRWPEVPDGFGEESLADVPAPAFDPPPADWADAPPAFAPTAAHPEVQSSDAPWEATLADLPPAARDDLAAVRDRFGSVTDILPSLPDDFVPPAEPPRFAAADPVPAFPISCRFGPEIDLAGLRHAAAVCRHNLANAFTPGYRRLEPVTAETPGLGGAAAGGTREAPDPVNQEDGPPAGDGGCDSARPSNVDVEAELARLADIERLLDRLDAAPPRVAARP